MGWVAEPNTQSKPTQQARPGWKADYTPPKGRGQSPDRPINLSGMSHADEQAAIASLPKHAYYVSDDGQLRQNENGAGGNPALPVPKGAFLGKDDNIYAPDPYKKGSTPRLDFHPSNGWYMKSFDGQYVGPDGKVKQGVGPQQKSLGGQINGALSNVDAGIPLGDELRGGMIGVDNVVRGLSGDPHYPIHNLGDVGSTLSGGMRQQREIQDAYATDHPAAANLLKGTGAASTLLIPGPKGLVGGTRLQNAMRGAVTAGAYGAGFAATDRGTMGERLTAAGQAANPVTNPVGYAIGTVAGAAAPGTKGPKPPKTFNTTTPQGLLQSEGVPLTPGQKMGTIASTIEEKASSAPILGDTIRFAKRGQFSAYNRAEANRALAPIGETVPPGMEAGTEMTAYVRDRLKAAYNDAHAMIPTVAQDAPFKAGMSNALREAPMLPPDKIAELQTLLNNRVQAQLSKGPLSGRAVKEIVSDLGGEQKSYTASTVPADQRIARILGDVKGELKGLVERQNPAAGDLLKRTDQGYAQYKRIEKAASSVANPDGIYTPAQMFNAVKAGDKTAGGFATGESHGYDLASAAKRVLGDKIPDSGTAGRLGLLSGATALGTSGGALAMGNPVPAAVTAGTGITLGAASVPYYNIGRAGMRGPPIAPSSPSPGVLALQQELAMRLSRVAGAVPMLSPQQQLLTQPR